MQEVERNLLALKKFIVIIERRVINHLNWLSGIINEQRFLRRTKIFLIKLESFPICVLFFEEIGAKKTDNKNLIIMK